MMKWLVGLAMLPALIAQGAGVIEDERTYGGSLVNPFALGETIVAGVHNTEDYLYVGYVPGQWFSVPLARTGATCLECVPISATRQMFFVGGVDASGVGYVVAVDVVGGVASAPVDIFSSLTAAPVDILTSSTLGEIYVFCPGQGVVSWKPLDHNAPAAGVWGDMIVALPSGTDHYMGMSDPSTLLISPSEPMIPGLTVSLQGGGVATFSSAEPALMAEFGVKGDVVKSSGVVEGFAPPGAVVEAFDADSGASLGFGVADANGDASIAVGSLTMGSVVSVRSITPGVAFHGRRPVFEKHGVSDTGASGLKIADFGNTVAATAKIGNAYFRTVFLGTLEDYAGPSDYIGLAILGYPSNVTPFPGVAGGFLLMGTGAVGIPTILSRSGGIVTSSAPLPLMNDPMLVGTELCFQWLVSDTNQFIGSNIACVALRAADQVSSSLVGGGSTSSFAGNSSGAVGGQSSSAWGSCGVRVPQWMAHICNGGMGGN